MTAWSPSQYLRFEDERSRPARDLLAQVPLVAPRRIVDIGCGPGNSTELLAARYPEAEVIGLDSSPEMLAAARKRLPECAFVEADITAWRPDEPVNLLFANAVLQWVPDHLAVLARLFGGLAPGAALAVQMPDNLREPSHALMHAVAANGPWMARFAAPIVREEIPPPSAYYDLFASSAARIDIWHTVYQHPLDGPAAIVDWVRATGLRPYLARLEEGDHAAFLAEYESELARAYPPLTDGKVLFRFPRLFVVATRTDAPVAP
jgi:trans-aconitate 2-methyltransferase